MWTSLDRHALARTNNSTSLSISKSSILLALPARSKCTIACLNILDQLAAINQSHLRAGIGKQATMEMGEIRIIFCQEHSASDIDVDDDTHRSQALFRVRRLISSRRKNSRYEGGAPTMLPDLSRERG